MIRCSLLLAAIASWALVAGCATIGQEFAVHNVPQLEIGETTREDVVRLFGRPWRTGLENGQVSWTYGHYRYSLFGREKTRDLVLRFDDAGRLASYSFSSTEPGDLDGGADPDSGH